MSVEWWIRREGNALGPYSVKQIEGFARDEQLSEEDELRLGRTTQWTLAGELNWLDEYFHVVEEVDLEPAPDEPCEDETKPAALTTHNDTSEAVRRPVEQSGLAKRFSPSVVTVLTWGFFAVSLAVVVLVAMFVFPPDEGELENDGSTKGQVVVDDDGEDDDGEDDDGEDEDDDDDEDGEDEDGDGDGEFPDYIIANVKDEDRATQAIGLVASGWHGIDAEGERFDRQQLGLVYNEREANRLPSEIQDKLILLEGPSGQLSFIEPLLGGTGTCFLVSPDGYAITNKHVIHDYVRIGRASSKKNRVQEVFDFEDLEARLWVFLNGKPHKTKVVHESTEFDLAILKISGIKDSPCFRLHGGNKILRGTKVWAMGFPGISRLAISEEESFDDYLRSGTTNINLWFKDSDFDYSLTDGSVSVVSERSGFGSAIQHNVDINPGNSGGPLLTQNGCVVGINTLGFSESSGVFFALSVTDQGVLGEIENAVHELQLGDAVETESSPDDKPPEN